MKRILPTTLLIAATLTTPALAAEKPTMRTVCADSTYVRHTPTLTMIGTLFKDQKITVKRYDKSGKHAYGFAYGHVNRNGWVQNGWFC